MPRSEKTITREVPTSSLTKEQFDAIWSVYAPYHERDRAEFERTLCLNHKVLMFHDAQTEALQGFLAVSVFDVQEEERSFVILYFGTLVIHSGFRGQNIVQNMVLREYLGIRRRYGFRKIYFIFSSLSYMSYLAMSHTFLEYWPRREQPTPQYAQEVLTYLIEQIFKGKYDPSGVSQGTGQKRVTDQKVTGTETNLDPQLAFYLKNNPGHQHGDCLMCFIPLYELNILTLIFKRHVQRPLKKLYKNLFQ
ncbi:MAG: hypothetical protein HQM11_16750 [SAR324 cluster bacterium]|nr:hypothetical protein [SAR324 cluster bacterium]